MNSLKEKIRPVTRTPIKVGRQSITVFSESGMSIGGWFAFPRPFFEPSPKNKLKRGETQLWCPYCSEFTIFKKIEDREYCQGVCGWAVTSDFYVRKYNDLWR